MAKGITWIGMDAHKKFISVAMLLPRRKTTEEWKVNNEPKALKRLVRKLEREAPGEIRCCYEAGVCGFALQRTLQALSKGRLVCEVIAPALVPRKAGERIKTDRRDARKLAELFRACLLTEVHPPQADDEAVRDLCRCREDAQEDLMRARHRLSKWLLRRGLSFTGTKNWSLAHRHWLKGLSFEHEADAATFHDYLRSMEQIEERLKDLMENIERMAVTESYAEAVGLLRCFRGIDSRVEGWRGTLGPRSSCFRRLSPYLPVPQFVPSPVSIQRPSNPACATNAPGSPVPFFRPLSVAGGFRHRHSRH